MVLRKARLGGNYANQEAETDFPLMKMGNIARGYFEFSKVEYVARSQQPEDQHRLAHGDVLFNTRNTLDLVGKVAIWRNELPLAYYNSNLMRLEFDPGEIVSNDYANYALNAYRAVASLRAMATGTTSVAAIYTRDLLALPFVVPPKEEQRAIATALSDVDALLDGLMRLIAKKRDLKQAAMQQLLSGQRRLPGFKRAWCSQRLGSLGVWLSGGTPSMAHEDFWKGDIPWISPKDMKRPRLYDAIDHVSESAVGNGTRVVPPGALLTVVRGMILARSFPVARAERAVAFNQDIKALVPREGVDSNFLLYWFGANEARFLSATNEATHGTKRIPSEALFAMEVLLPELSEQIAIATVLSDMDAELAALEARRAKTQALKQAMMQALLTGRIRLVSPEPAYA
jgi:type I restriction enzyme S subunit